LNRSSRAARRTVNTLLGFFQLHRSMPAKTCTVAASGLGQIIGQ